MCLKVSDIDFSIEYQFSGIQPLIELGATALLLRHMTIVSQWEGGTQTAS